MKPRFDDPASRLALRLPPELAPLARMAYDLAWCWQPGAAELFRALDPERATSEALNPIRQLVLAPPAALARAARDPGIVRGAADIERALAEHRARPAADAPPASDAHPIAFFCAEYGVQASLPLYSGGLGVLAGDYLKEASDRALPLVAVGLFYRRGYFRQLIDRSGWQHEFAVEAVRDQLPMALALNASGEVLLVDVPLGQMDVRARIWRVQVGRVPLFLLDTDVPQNPVVARWITAQLYVARRELRLLQYAMLGIGGARALEALGISPAVVHLNEGHAALAVLELARGALGRRAGLAAALADVRERIVFTTHTPVAAGNESYTAEEIIPPLARYLGELGVTPDELLALGRTSPADQRQSFGLTQLALRSCRSANGVSRKHGQVAREMWRALYPGTPVERVPITHVTNGVHLPTWMAPPMRALLGRHLGEGWEGAAADPQRWAAVAGIPDEELWDVRCALRARLVERVRARSVVERLARGESLAYSEEAARTFDEKTLTLGFARRLASYKRLHVLISNASRALQLLAGPRPVQVVIAGKAHPMDDEAKRLVQMLFALKEQPMAGSRVAVLEDYDLDLAAELVAGCDVWINLPRAPLEASGTSGMKAALSGGLQLSVLDGWWPEAYDGGNGWAIASDPGLDAPVQDARDADTFYRLLENEVVPLYYARDGAGIPRGWIQRVKASIRSIGPTVVMARTVPEYFRRIYAAGV